MSGPFNSWGNPNAMLPLMEDVHEPPIRPTTPVWEDGLPWEWPYNSMFPSPSPSGSPEPAYDQATPSLEQPASTLELSRTAEDTHDQDAPLQTPPTSSSDLPRNAQETGDQVTPPRPSFPGCFSGVGLAPGPRGNEPPYQLDQVSFRKEGFSCYCGKPDDDNAMVACDNTKEHDGDLWFHYGCANLDDAPETQFWYCYQCVRYGRDEVHQASLPKATDSNQEEPSNESNEGDESEDVSDYSEPVRHGKRKRSLTEEEPEDSSKKQRKAPQNRPQEQSEGSESRSNLRSGQSKGSSAQASDPTVQQAPARPASTPASIPKTTKGLGSWSDAENAACITEMQAIRGQYVTLEEFQKASKDKLWKDLEKRLLTNHNINRGNNAVKMQWGRVLRNLSGIDERSRPDATRLVTSAQTSSPKKRKAAPTAATSSNPAASNTSASSSAAASSNAAGSAAPRSKRPRIAREEEEKEEEGEEEEVGGKAHGNESEAHEEEDEAGDEQDAPASENQVGATVSGESDDVEDTEDTPTARPGETDEDFARRLERQERVKAQLQRNRSRHR